MAQNFVNCKNLLLFLIFAKFCHQRVESIFYHVLGSCVIQEMGYAGPFLSVFFHELVYFVVFLVRPFTFVFALVQVIEPAFSAMFRGFEDDLP